MNLEKAWIHDSISVIWLFFFLCPESESIHCPAALTVSSAGWEAFSLSSEDRSTNSHHLTFSTSLIGRRSIPSATTIEGAGVLGSTSDVPALLSRDEGMDGTSSGLIGNDGQDSRAAPAKRYTHVSCCLGTVDLWVLAGILMSHLVANGYWGYWLVVIVALKFCLLVLLSKLLDN